MRRLIKAAVIAVLILSAGIFVKGSITQPSIGGWLSAGAMTAARSSAASALLQDGRILITGGDNGSGPVASAEFFDTAGAFVAAPPMSTPRGAHSATVLADGRILVAGGSTGTAATNAAEIFDPTLNSWTAVAGGMVQARSNHTASLLADGRVLFAGGDNAGTPTASLEIFDPVAGSFSSAGVMSSPRKSFASAVLSDGRVILIGGSNGTAPVATTEIFDPLSNSVSAGAALSVPRMAHSATTLLDGRVLVAGGTTVVTNPAGSTSNTDLASAEIYDPATGAFGASTSSLAAARRDHTAFLLPNNNSVLIVGGTSSGNEIGTAEMFVPSTGTFAPTGSPAAARQRATGTALKQDGILLLAGGSNSTGTLSSAELYGFATVKTDKADYAPGTIVTITGSGWQPGETVTLTLVESPLVDTHPVMTAVADSTGKIVNTDFSPDEYDISIRFYLTAVGSISGIQAQNTFTDGNATVSGKVTSSATGNPIQGATVACDITSGCNASSSTTTLADGTYSFKPSFAGNGPAIFSVTASATGFNPGSSSPISVPNSGNGMTFAGVNIALTPSVSGTTTTVASSPNPSTYGGSITFTATVVRLSGANTPTGTVSIKDGATAVCTTGILSGSGGTATASCAVSTLSVSGSPHSITAVYGGDGNFTGSTSAAISQTVNAKPVTATLTADDKAYDGNATEPNAKLHCALPAGSAVGTDDVSCTASSGTFNSSQVTAANTVTATVALAGTTAGNYSLTSTSASATAHITAKPVTATLTADDKAYDGNATEPDAKLHCALPAGSAVGTDDVSCTASSGTFNSSQVAAANTVTATVALAGTTAGNYSLTSTSASATAHITAKPVTATLTADDKAYDGNATEPDAKLHCALPAGSAVGTDDVSCTASSGTFNSSQVAAANTVTATVALAGTTAGNYSLTSTSASATAHITAKPVTATLTADDKAYDGNATEPNAKLHCALPAGSAVGTDDVSCTASSGTFNSSQVTAANTVTATVALTGTTAGNYSLTSTSASATAHITAKPVTATLTADDKAYDGNATEPDAKLHCALPVGSAVGTDDVSCTASSGTFNSSQVTAANTVTATVALTGTTAGNYSLTSTSASATAHITAKPVTATLTADDKAYDGNATEPDAKLHCALPVGSAVGTDDVSCTASSGTFNSSQVAAANTVTATVALTGTTAGNYSLSSTSASATAHITAKPVTATLTADDKAYDGNATEPDAKLHCALPVGSAVGTDDVSCTASSGTFNSSQVTAANTVTATVALTGTTAGNYSLTSTSASATAHITAVPVTPAIAADGKDYDGTVAAIIHCTVSGVLTGDTMNVTCSGTGSFADANAGIGKTVTSSDLALSGSASGNYVLSTTTAATTATINKVNQTITWADPAGITYGTLLSATQLNATVAGVSGGSGPGALTYTPGAGTLLNAGAAQGLRVDAASTINYNPATLTVHISVSKATPTVTWSDPADIVYGSVLSGTQLNATFTWLVGATTVPVAGVATYTPPIGTLLGAGATQALAVNFAPTDTANYNPASATVHISVQKATPIVTWSTPADIAYGTALSGSQLNATFSWVVNGSPVAVAGIAAYTPAAGTVLNPGASQVLTVNFSPADMADYNNAGPKTVAINVGYGMCSAAVGPGGVILPPINSDGTSVYNRKGGSTIPVKFRVCNASGASISNPAVVFAGTGGTLTMLSAVRGTIDNINETTGTDIPDVAFRWDGQQWIFNMATNNLTSGSTYAFRINLAYAPASITFVVGVK